MYIAGFLGDQLAIGKETGRRLGMGTNMYPSSSLLGAHKDESIAALPVDELIEKADGFAGVFPGSNLLRHALSICASCEENFGEPKIHLDRSLVNLRAPSHVENPTRPNPHF